MIECSPYLLRKIRTPRQACREIAFARPERLSPDCPTCGLRTLCKTIGHGSHPADAAIDPEARAASPEFLRLEHKPH